jgi:Family of unknown function (DUF6515)
MAWWRWYGGGCLLHSSRLGARHLCRCLAIGATVRTPPPYYRNVVYGGTSYIYSDGVFMQPSGSSYIVIKPPIGAIVPSIPEGCDATDTGGTVFYDCSEIVYQPIYQGSSLVYRVVRF